MSENLKDLNIIRGQVKAAVTRIQKYVDKLPLDNFDREQLDLRREALRDKFREFEQIQTRIEILEDSPDHEVARESFENNYYALMARIDRLLPPPPPPASPVPPPPIVGDHSFTNSSNQQIRLPKIDLPQFRGAYEEWYPFHDTFVSLIHNNTSLSPVQKFHYLRSSLKGEAIDVIRSLEISTINYIEAWNLLKSRYGNKRLIVQTHLRALSNLPSLQKENSAALRQLLDGTLKHTRALAALNRPVDQWDDWLVHVIAGKLDSITNKEWETRLTPLNLPTFRELTEFLTHRCQVLEAVTGKSPKATNFDYNRQNQRQSVASNVASKSFACQTCGGNHYIHQCEKFIALPIKERIKEVKSKKLCLNCLRSTNHNASSCNSGTCRKCNGKHNTMLHIVVEPSQNVATAIESGVASGSNTVISNISHGSHAEKASQVYLSTAIIEVFDSRGRAIVARVLLDSGSQSCFITEDLASRLRLRQDPFDVPIVGINQATTRAFRKVAIKFKSRFNSFSRAIDCIILNNITQNIPSVSVERNDFKIPNNIKLADPTFYKSSRIDILLGVEVFYDVLCVGQIKATRSHPCLQKSHFGWLVSGRALLSGNASPSIICNVVTHNKDLDHMIARFWELENCSISVARTRQEKDCEEHFASTHTRNADGRFIVKLPMKNNNLHELGDNRSIALKRFYNLERKLNKQPDLKREYCNFMKEYEELGHMIAVADNEEAPMLKYYMPHHAVFKQNSLTTKLRVVFDASCKSQTGISLNDILTVGPNLQEDLFSIIARFRTHTYVITADVAKMYRQVLVDRSQTSLQRILWRDDEGKAIRTYELLTVTYGTAPASFLATKCLHEIAELERGSSPTGAMIIQRDFYVDDLLTGANTVSELIRIRDQVIGVLSKAGFVLRKWASNIAESSQGLPEDSESNMLLNLNKDDDIWALGIQWNPNKDSFQYFAPTSNSSRRVTKRSILSSVARVFDPLGLLGPVTVTAKILVQRLWQQGLDWDESVPVALHTLWSRYEEQLPMLNNIRIGRHVVCKDATKIEMHGFSDASENAYGACVYIVSYDAHGNIDSKLLCAKSRVAPLKIVSLPRLELCGAVLLARLINKLSSVLCLSLVRIRCWSDSAIVLAWLKSPSRAWNTFVANRVSEIQELTPVSYWGHVPSAQNPADVISRGVSPSEILNLAIWWEGPISLMQNCNNAIPEVAPQEIPERRSPSIICAVSANKCLAPSREFNDFIFSRFSSFIRLTRVIAYVIRFAHNGRNVNNRITGPLTNLELEKSRTCLVKICQALALQAQKAQRATPSPQSSSKPKTNN